MGDGILNRDHVEAQASAARRRRLAHALFGAMRAMSSVWMWSSIPLPGDIAKHGVSFCNIGKVSTIRVKYLRE